MSIFDQISQSVLPTAHGEFRVHAFREHGGVEHLALVRGVVEGQTGVLVRVHSECLTGDVFGSRRCDCGEQLELALQRIAAAGTGVCIYVRGHEGRGIGLQQKIAAYAKQDEGLDTVEANLALGQPADRRSYAAPAEILRHLGVVSIRLMSNNPTKRQALEREGVKVLESLSHEVPSNPDNHRYMQTKRQRMGHVLRLPDSPEAQPSEPEQADAQ
ncbi:GTP cyclohydrolase II [Uliginosibacterium sp. TH139]|uniref:GTP cyclohydrolase II n=1 Tax=Uliginosibacterium sp. TH139 TaxID=2067453 RepID=UPI000C7D57C2|nr:GTP cyclohydrolase II [Uliginosibacterium sp. TH139]PLK47020.1 GTP cyclohydrolase II [Uliginosibacterium sp. TH139]